MVDLKNIRVKHGMTQKQLSEKCGVVRQAITNIECGANLPSVKTAKAIGKILGFDWALFFDEKVILNGDGGDDDNERVSD